MIMERAKEILYDETSENQTEHIDKFPFLMEAILNAMKRYYDEKEFDEEKEWFKGELEDETLRLHEVIRVEVIDEKGRSYVNWDSKNKVQVSIQDDGKTMKIFISKEKFSGAVEIKYGNNDRTSFYRNGRPIKHYSIKDQYFIYEGRKGKISYLRHDIDEEESEGCETNTIYAVFGFVFQDDLSVLEINSDLILEIYK